jgi:hypothetical protein
MFIADELRSCYAPEERNLRILRPYGAYYGADSIVYKHWDPNGAKTKYKAPRTKHSVL